MKNLPLSDEEATVLTRELTEITWNDRYPLSPRVQTLKAILAKLAGSEPAREQLTEPRSYDPAVQAIRVDTEGDPRWTLSW